MKGIDIDMNLIINLKINLKKLEWLFLELVQMVN